MPKLFIIVLVVFGVVLLLGYIIIIVEKLAGFAVALLYLLFGLAFLLGGVKLLVDDTSGTLIIIMALIMALFGALLSWGGISLFLNMARTFKK